MVRGRPSGLKAAPHRLRRRPAAGPDPGDHCGPWAAGTKGQAKGLPPGKRAAPRLRLTPGTVNAERVIYRHRCNDPLNPRGFISTKSEILSD
jgi:hypothetical protein